MPYSAVGKTPGFASFQCADAQEQAEVLLGWNQEYYQLSRGAFAGEVLALRLDGTYVFIESANRLLLQRGYLSPGAVGIAVPLKLGGTARFCGRPSSLDEVYVYSGRGGFEFCSPADHRVAGIALTPEDAQSLSLQASGGRLAPDLTRRAHTRAAAPASLQATRRFVTELVQARAAQPALLEHAHARAALKDALLANLVALFDAETAPAHEAPELRTRWQLVSRARDRIAASPGDPVTVADLCNSLGVSRRTLQYCFQDVLGISPLNYLRAIRLNGVRKALRSAPSVTAAALDWGFWHLGQFATDYRLMFGERPSETFRRHHG
jgi:AraC family ethanolamine operon transcriptional activator